MHVHIIIIVDTSGHHAYHLVEYLLFIGHAIIVVECQKLLMKEFEASRTYCVKKLCF